MTPIITPINYDELRALGEHADEQEADAAAALSAIDGFGNPLPGAIEVARIREGACDLIVERSQLSDVLAGMEPGVYGLSLGHMTREALDNLPEFQG